jgi:hypothetical protein
LPGDEAASLILKLVDGLKREDMAELAVATSLALEIAEQAVVNYR